MKKILLTVLAAQSLIFSAYAQDVRVEPGPDMNLGDATSSAVEALLIAKKSDLQKFSKAGNRIQSVTLKNLNPNASLYTFFTEMCMKGGAAGGTCTGGARLTVLVEEVRKGSMVFTQATSKVVLLRAR